METRTARACWTQVYGFRIVRREPDASSRALNRAAVARSQPYLAYLMGEPRFGCEIRNSLQSARRPILFDRRYLSCLLDYCKRTTWGKRLAVCR